MAARRQQGRRKRVLKRRQRVQSVRGVPSPVADDAGETTSLLDERMVHTESTPAMSGGDVDADWQGAQSTGEEAVGGSVPTPDQDVVDEIGRALGVEQGSEEEVRTSGEILGARRRLYWHLERKAADAEEAAG